jgi:hypothetical protein
MAENVFLDVWLKERAARRAEEQARKQYELGLRSAQLAERAQAEGVRQFDLQHALS